MPTVRATGNTVSLSSVPDQARVRVVQIIGSRCMVGRLRGLGILPGAEVTVLSGRRGGPVLISYKGNRIAIGCGMASQIMVELLSAENSS